MDRLVNQTDGLASAAERQSEKLLDVSVKDAHAEGVKEGHEGPLH